MPDSEETRREIHRVGDEAASLRSTAIELSKKFDAHDRTITTLRRLTIAVGFLVVAALIAGLTMASMIWNQNKQVARYLEDGQKSRAAIAEIDDCINPRGRCYQAQQKKTADIILKVVDANGNGVADITEILMAINAQK